MTFPLNLRGCWSGRVGEVTLVGLVVLLPFVVLGQMSETMCLTTLAGDTWSPSTESCFKANLDKFTAQESFALCNSLVNGHNLSANGLRGRLAHIKTEAVSELIGEQAADVWIGLRHRSGWAEQPSALLWMDGPDVASPVECAGWLPAGSEPNKDDECTYLKEGKGKGTEWKEEECGKNKGRLCEFLNADVPLSGDVSACAEDEKEFCTVPPVASGSWDVAAGTRLDKYSVVRLSCDEGFVNLGAQSAVCVEDPNTGQFNFAGVGECVPRDGMDKIACRVLGEKLVSEGETLTWLTKLNNDGVTATVKGLAKGAMMQAQLDALSVEDQVARLFDALLDRPPSAEELSALAPRLPAERDVVIDELVASAEYLERNGDSGVPGNGRVGCAGGQSPLMLEGERKYLIGAERLLFVDAVAFCEERNMNLIGRDLADEDQRDIAFDVIRAFQSSAAWEDSEDHRTYWLDAALVDGADPESHYAVRPTREPVLSFVEDSWAAGEPEDDDCGDGSCAGRSWGLVWDSDTGLFRDLRRHANNGNTAHAACVSSDPVTSVDSEPALADPSSACASRGGLVLGFRCFEAEPAPASWPAAQSLCRQLGGRLPAPSSAGVLAKLAERMGADGRATTWLGGRFADVLQAAKPPADLLRRRSVAAGVALADGAGQMAVTAASGFFPPLQLADGLGRDCLVYEGAQDSASNADCFAEKLFYCEFEQRSVRSMVFEQAQTGQLPAGAMASEFPATSLTKCTEECLKELVACVWVAYDVGTGGCALGTLKGADAVDLTAASPDLFLFDVRDDV